ncbi:MAG: tetratricopeptide repeat protein, partial [Devosia sp.]
MSGLIRFSLRSAVLGSALLALAAPAAYAGPLLDACAAEAASQYEPGFADIGKDLWAIDAKAAIAACEKALKDDPSSSQLKGWLARAYYADGDYERAIPLFEEASADGNVVALSIYGDMLTTGDGVDEDMARGAELLTKGAEAGFALAQNSLGLSYDFGEGLTQDYTEAAKWYRAAAEQGMAKAQSNLGLMYQDGL